MSNTNGTGLDLLSNEMKVNGNIFHSGMEHRIRIELGGPYIVTINDWTLRHLDVQF